MRKWINLFENIPSTYTLPKGTKLYHARMADNPYPVDEMNFPAWFSFTPEATYTSEFGKTEILEFVTTRELQLMDGEDDEIQSMYDEGSHTDEIAEIPSERGYVGWMIPGEEVLLNDKSAVAAVSLAEGLAYPMADRDRDGWFSDGTYEAMGGEIVYMSPDEYLSRVRPLVIDDESEENIEILMGRITNGLPIDPLKIYHDGREDGRHRAHAAKRLGVESVPVIVFPPKNLRESRLKDGRELVIKSFEEELPDYDEEWVVINVWAELDGKSIGSLTYDTVDEYVRGVEVEEEYRRLGVATAMYDYLETLLGHPIKPSPYLERDGAKFWMNRNQKVTEAIDLPWGHGQAGCWITDTGEFLPCDYEADYHHGDIVADGGEFDDLEDELDELVDMGQRKGWVRIRMDATGFNVSFNAREVSQKALRQVPRVVDGQNDFHCDIWDGEKIVPLYASSIGQLMGKIRDFLAGK